MIKKIVKPWTPDYHFQNVFQITPELLKAWEVKTIITDLDNTLSSRYCRQPSTEIVNWIAQFQPLKIDIIILSNSKSPDRVQEMATLLGIESWYAKSAKPFRKTYLEAAKHHSIAWERTVVVGDQTLTDIWGGNRMGAISILVAPFIETPHFQAKPDQPKEPIFFPLMKWMDNIVTWLSRTPRINPK